MKIAPQVCQELSRRAGDRKSTRLNSSHSQISYAVFCLKKKNANKHHHMLRFLIEQIQIKILHHLQKQTDDRNSLRQHFSDTTPYTALPRNDTSSEPTE